MLKKKKKISKFDKGFFALIFRYAKKYKITFTGVVIFSILSSLSTIFISITITAIIAGLNGSNIVSNHSGEDVTERLKSLSNLFLTVTQYNDTAKVQFLFMNETYKQWIVILLISFIAMVILFYLSTHFSGHFGLKIQVGVRNETMYSLIKQDISYYSLSKTGATITKLASDTMIVGDQCEVFFSDAFSSIISIFFGGVILFLTDWRVSLIVFAILLFVLSIIFVSIFISDRMFTKLRNTITDVNSYVTDRVSTIRLIKSSATEDYEIDIFKNIHNKYIKEVYKNEAVTSSFQTWIWVCVSSIQIISILLIAEFYGEDANLSVLLSSFVTILSILTGPIVVILKMVPDFVKSKVSIRRVNNIVYSESIIDPHYDDGLIIDKIEGDIIFDKIRFAYPEKPEKEILPKFDFTFKEGKSYAFVGTTGSGKSTISRLVLRFYDPTEGRVLINNNIDLKEVNLSSYLRRVGYVEQEPQIIYGSVLDNIKYSNGQKSDDEAIEACKKAELHDVVMSWPNQYQTILGERGFMLSGGQKQRLVIARMFLKQPQLLILDEATSALDNVVEKEIQVKLEELTKGRTTIIIAHRLSTIINCDEIIVLDSGKGIVQRGSFNQLVKEEGYFKRLYEAGRTD